MQDLIDKRSVIAKDTNVLNNDCISRQTAIDAFLTELTKRERKNLLHTWSTVEVKYFVAEMLERLPSPQPEITPDGTLNVSIDADIANVGRILLSQAGTQRGGLYYKDEQPEPKWIPCKERLPDKDGLYLVTYFSGHARWTGTDEFLVDGTEESHWKYANIIAWQPLPKPFREGGDYA